MISLNLAWREACAAICEDDKETIHSIAREVARKHRISLRELRGMGREKDLCAARFEAWLLCKRLGKSSIAIGRYFSDRDHATILHGIKKARNGKD